MPSIPPHALKFGAMSINKYPVSYGKARVAGSQLFSYIMHSRAGSMPGQPDLFAVTENTAPEGTSDLQDNPVISAFKRKRFTSLGQPIRNRKPESFIDSFTFDVYAPYDDCALKIAIKAAYRQIYGNFHAMESEKPLELERHLRNGDLTIREFIRGLIKSDFYLNHYYFNVNQQRAIELSIKNILGRPPFSQEEIAKYAEVIHHKGFINYLDQLIDSSEYDEVFGKHIVPYPRSWNSPCGLSTSSFNRQAKLTRSFATSDNAIHSRRTSADAASGKSELLRSLAKGVHEKILLPWYSQKRL